MFKKKKKSSDIRQKEHTKKNAGWFELPIAYGSYSLIAASQVR